MIPGRMRVSVIQSRIERDWERNLERIRDIASTASNPDLLAIYENWLGRSPISLSDYLKASQEVLDSSGSRIYIAGSAYLSQDRAVVSKSIIIEKTGRVEIGGKSFPSAATGERMRIRPGGPPAIMRTSYGYSVASIICVDAIYPEVVRIASTSGSEIIANPSIIPANRFYLWRSLGILRASENTVFFIHINPTNTKYFDGRDVMGGSYISDPQGRIILEAGSDEGVYEAIVDLGEVYSIRARWRYLEDIAEAFGDIYRGIRDAMEKRGREKETRGM